MRLHILCFVLSFLFAQCSTPTGEHHPEWEKYFDEYHVPGCITIYDLTNSRFIDYNADRCTQRFIPASTFKIPNSIIALETKVIPDTSFVIKWDSVVRRSESWNRDQSMQDAFHHSAVWYYQEIAKKVGVEKYQYYLNLFHYGNMNPGGALDSFWLTGDLRISCDEQVEFLKNFYSYQLRVSKRTIDLVKGMMLLEKNPAYTFSGKTGWGMMDSEEQPGKQKNIGWLVGYVEKGTEVYFFALNIESPEPSPADFAASREKIARDCLRAAGIIP